MASRVAASTIAYRGTGRIAAPLTHMAAMLAGGPRKRGARVASIGGEAAVHTCSVAALPASVGRASRVGGHPRERAYGPGDAGREDDSHHQHAATEQARADGLRAEVPMKLRVSTAHSQATRRERQPGH